SNVKNNTKIAWKNIAIVNNGSGEAALFANVIVANFRAAAEEVTFFLQVPMPERQTILDWGQVFVQLPSGLIRTSDDNAGVRQLDNRTFQVLKPEARLGRFTLAPGAMHVLRTRFAPKPR